MNGYEKYFKVRLEVLKGIHDAQQAEFGRQKHEDISDYLHLLHNYIHGQIDLIKELMAMPGMTEPDLESRRSVWECPYTKKLVLFGNKCECDEHVRAEREDND